MVCPTALECSPNRRDISSGDFEMPFGIEFQGAARFFQRTVLTNAGDDILKRAALRHVVQHIVHRDQRNKRAVRYIL